MTKRVAIYCRVSTREQTCDNQLADLRRYASERGWTMAGEYIDDGISGTVASRPALDRMMDTARKRKIDIVLVWRFDRFARSVKHLVLALDELRGLNVDFISYSENVDTTTPLGAAIFTIIAAMGALERDIIVERVRAGLNRARREGKKIGRPCMAIAEAEVLRLRERGQSMRQIAAALGTSQTKILKMLRSAAVTKPLPKAVS